VALMMDVPNMDKLSALMQSKAAADAMAHDGVVLVTWSNRKGSRPAGLAGRRQPPSRDRISTTGRGGKK
jgi:hypothetical protein